MTGIIDEMDDADGDGRITSDDGGLLNPPISVDRICAVRVWLLAAADSPYQGFVDMRTHVVGDRVIAEPKDRVSRMLLESIVQCRNL